MISRIPRQVIGFAVDTCKLQTTIQGIVDSVPPANTYHTDGYYGYADIDFLGRHNQNIYNKKDTHNIESINADLRHYVPGLRRRSRCFYRTLETFRAVLAVFTDAYNKYGEAKLNYRTQRKVNPLKRIEYPFSILDFL
jgi:IS1 family transposase